MIQIQNLSISFGTQKILNNASFIINDHERVGLVGLNGSGKSTLLKIISNQSEQNNYIVQHNCSKKIGYLPQEVILKSRKSVIDEVISSLNINYEETESIKAEAKKLLMGLGFSITQIEQSVSDLSEGWKMRIVLATLLLQKADFYLFDEPTNHLDIVTKEWFLTFLKKAPFGFLLVCHDRYFLDNLCTSIIELENGNCKRYNGNYSSYLEQKEKNRITLEAAYVQQQKEIKRKQDTIDRFKASATRSAAAKSMQKALDKIERIELPNIVKKVNFKFPPSTQSGQIVLTLTNIKHSFGTKQIFSNISFTIERNEKVALIAANGVGKTTLLNIVIGKYNLQKGEITFGHNVSPAFFEQDQVRALDPEKTIFETIQSAVCNVTDLAIRNMLGCFLFSKDTIEKKTKVLSGGERNRLSMARVLLQQKNLLLLDEPTNHLDIPSKEILLDALKQYNGTILFVSHDQDFVNNLATHIIELTSTGAYKYSGNYDDYLNQKKYIENGNNLKTVQAEKNKPSKNNFEINKEIKKIENQIEKIDSEINKLSLELSNFKYGTTEFSSLHNQINELQKKHKLLLEEWEQIVNKKI